MFSAVIGVMLLSAHSVHSQDNERCYRGSCDSGQCCRTQEVDNLDGTNPSCQPLQQMGEFCSEELNEDLDAYEGWCPCEDGLFCQDNQCTLAEEFESLIY
uniref:Prokineticin domain-containing protein n=1 Tax=Graphocephala atropunctata TaxID=36148 RepID=A0A1B6L6Q1_9HEMI